MSDTEEVREAGGGFVEGIVREARLIPYTAIAVLAILAALGFYVLPAVGRIAPLATEVTDISNRLGGMESRIRRDALMNRLSGLETETFQLEREQATLERLSQEVPLPILERLHRLRVETATTRQELDAVLAKLPADETHPP